ncbi:MAG: hypothetical protein QG621_192 [Patescibacteria group bacterium]|nr:hypothetical protein [Patescibacteria group bacterium]
MDVPSTPPSFIPKKPVTNSARMGGSRAMGMVIFFFGLLVFVASSAGAGIAFFAQQYLTKQISDKSAQLQHDQATFDLPAIEDLARLDARMKNAESLMQRHYTAMTPLIYLGDQTLQTVQFTDYKYTVDPEDGAKITLAGIANSFGTVALQSDQFGASDKLQDVVFSNIQQDSSGKMITFSVTATLDQPLTSYAASLGTQNGSAATTTTATSTPGLLAPPPMPSATSSTSSTTKPR